MSNLSSLVPTTQPSEPSFEKSVLYLPRPSVTRKIDLPDNVLLSLLLYLDQFCFIKFRCLSRHWYCRIDLLFSNLCKPMEAGFEHFYSEYL